MRDDPVPLHRTIVAIDIDEAASRTNPERLELRAMLQATVEVATAGIRADFILHDASGRLLAIFEAKAPKNRLLDGLLEALPAALAEHNLGRSDPVRLRLALHAGEVVHDGHGYLGDALDIATWLAGSETARITQQLTAADLLVAVTEQIYRNVVEQSGDPTSYRQVVVESPRHRLSARFLSIVGGSPPRRPPPRESPGEPDDLHHRSILIVDIEDSDSRSDDVKRRHRSWLREMVPASIADAGIAPEQVEDRDTGDGLLMYFAPEVPKNRLIDPLVFSLGQQLDVYNRSVPSYAGLRLRVVLDAGELRRDGSGYFGSPLNEACWLMESDALRRGLRDTTAPLALMVSNEIYDGVVRHGYGLIRREEYVRHVVPLKSRDVITWLWTPPEM